MTIRALAATAPGSPLTPTTLTFGPLGDEEVEIAVSHCGVCHSDLSMIENDWQMAQYPLVPGHEVVGTIAALGRSVTAHAIGDRVGLGWYASSCMACRSCLGGDHNLCATAVGTIVGRPGGFAERVRCHWAWAMGLPATVNPVTAGPLFCGGATVFNPIVQFGVRPTDRVGVVGIGGLGHLALQFLNKWGCEVTAFSSSPGKSEEAKRLGAHQVVNSRDAAAMQKLARSFDFILVTVNASMPWQSYLDALAPRGRLHVVGVVPEPIPVPAFTLIGAQRSISGSPVGSPATVANMLEFCGRHRIEPVTEVFPMSKANEALDHLRAGKARHRIVLENDLGR